MYHRTPPSHEECVEAMQVMIEAYGYRRTLAMLEEAADKLKEEDA